MPQTILNTLYTPFHRVWWKAVPNKLPFIAYQAVGVASKAAAMVNLANPGTLDLVDQGTPSWTTLHGFVASLQGTNCIKTDGTPTNVQTVLVRFSGACDDGGLLSVIFNINSGYGFSMTNSIDLGEGGPFAVSYISESGASPNSVTIEPSMSYGVMALVRDTAAKKYWGYRNGIIDLEETEITTVPADEVLIFGNIRFANIQAVAIFHEVLSAEEVYLISTAMANLSPYDTFPNGDFDVDYGWQLASSEISAGIGRNGSRALSFSRLLMRLLCAIYQ
jgi:hypothetical protein